MEQLFKTIDVDGNGTIDFEEFLLLFKFKQPRHCVDNEDTQKSEDPGANERIMKMFDQDGSGFLSPQEWLQVSGSICLCIKPSLTQICCSNESSHI